MSYIRESLAGLPTEEHLQGLRTKQHLPGARHASLRRGDALAMFSGDPEDVLRREDPQEVGQYRIRYFYF